MPLNIISNFAAQVAQRNLKASDAEATMSLAKLSAGTRVLSARDDAAANAIGSRLKLEVNALKQASVNAGQAVSMLQIADGAMAKVNDILVRMKTLAVQAASGQVASSERTMLNTEYQALLSEVDRIANDTEFNGTKVVNGSITIGTGPAGLSAAANVVAKSAQGISTSNAVSLGYNSTTTVFTLTDGTTSWTGTLDSAAVTAGLTNSSTSVTLSTSGATSTMTLNLSAGFASTTSVTSATIALTGSTTNSFTYKVGTGTTAAEDDISITINSVTASSLALNGGDITSATNANTASAAISTAVNNLNTYRAGIGANQNRLDFAAANLSTAVENTEAARSQLIDLDVASEMAVFTSKQILVQAGVSMLAQANQLPGALLKLFQ